MNIQQKKWWGNVRNLPSLQEETYEEFFKKALDKFGVSSPDELEGDKKKEFFDYVDANWDGDNEEDEEVCEDCEEEVEEADTSTEDEEDEDEMEEDVHEAQSVPLVRTGQGSYTKDTHPSDSERLYQTKDKREYMKLMSDAESAMLQGMVAKFGIVGDYKKHTVNIKFKDAKSRKKFEKMNKIKESVSDKDQELLDFINENWG